MSKPVPEFQKFIVIAVNQSGSLSPATTPAQHNDLTTAKAEAERLAATNPGKTFAVFGSVGRARVENPAQWVKDYPSEIPF